MFIRTISMDMHIQCIYSFLNRSDFIFVVMEAAGERVPAAGGSGGGHPGILGGPDLPALNQGRGPDQEPVDETPGGNSQYRGSGAAYGAMNEVYGAMNEVYGAMNEVYGALNEIPVSVYGAMNEIPVSVYGAMNKILEQCMGL